MIPCLLAKTVPCSDHWRRPRRVAAKTHDTPPIFCVICVTWKVGDFRRPLRTTAVHGDTKTVKATVLQRVHGRTVTSSRRIMVHMKPNRTLRTAPGRDISRVLVAARATSLARVAVVGSAGEK